MTDRQKAMAAALKRGRARYKMGLREMARHIGIDPAQLSRVENGLEAPSDRILHAYADKFRMDFDELSTLAGRVPKDVKKYMVHDVEVVKRVRDEMREGMPPR